ncbi:MAG: phosphoesterase, PA-phosphatase related protein [Marmoricola sp.]|jgi:membrane-associated protein|nr:phosphoesterase, PA-phosphatase related protein [Marmoricola sp.]
MTDTLVHLLSTLGPAALVLLIVVAFAETGILVGFLLPGDTLMFSAGVLLAAGAIDLPLWLVLVVVTVAATAGDQVGYLIGRRFGPRVLNRPKSRLFSPRHLERARVFFERYGPRAVVLARFVPFARTMTPVVAGMGRMPRRRFALYNLGGAGAWALLTLGVGYWFGGIQIVADHLGLIAIGMAFISLLPVFVSLARARLGGGKRAHPVAPEVADARSARKRLCAHV